MAGVPRPSDSTPGPPPQIRADPSGLTFVMVLAETSDERLVVRCDADGEVWISIKENGRASSESAANPLE